MHPKVLMLFSLWDLIWETTSSDKKLKGDHQQLAELRCPDTSRPWKSLLPYHPRNLRKDTHSFGQLGSSYQPGDEVRERLEKKKSLQPVWTGPYMVVLVTPTAVKVIGVIPWIHHTRVKKTATSCDEDTWKTVQDPKNLLKIRFQRQRPSPTKDAESFSGDLGSWWLNAQQKLEDSSALLQPHSGSWPVNTWKKLEDPAIKISMDFHCKP